MKAPARPLVSLKAWILPLLVASLSPPAHADWKDNLPDPISPALLSEAPYRYAGILSSESGAASASVIKHKRVLLTAAHCLYDDAGNPQALPNWFNAYHGTSAPVMSDGIELYGRLRYNSYINYLQGGGDVNDAAAFNWDIATAFGFEDMVPGGTAPYTSDGANLLTSYKSKRVVGYPVSLYSSDSESPRPLPANAGDQFKMHSTSPVGHRLWKSVGHDHYYRATGQIKSVAKIVSAPGNSGGPVFVHDDNTWKVAGVLVSSVRDYLITGQERYSGRSGVRALDANAITALIDPLEHAGDCHFALHPTSRIHSASGGSGSISLSAEAACSWVVSMSGQDMMWIHPTGTTSGKGNATIHYDLDPNPLETTRSGKLMIGGKTFTIYQHGESTIDLRDRGEDWRSLSHTVRGPGQTLTIQADVINGGNNPTGSGYRVRYYASENNVISPSDIYLGERIMGELAAGQTASIDRAVVIPQDLGGYYYIGWIIDALNEVVEVNEGNNTVVMEGVHILRIDLLDGGGHQSLYNDVFPGEGVQFRGKVANLGNSSNVGSGSFKVKFYLSPVAALDLGFLNGGDPPAPKILDGDRFVGQVQMSVAGNESKQFMGAFDLPTHFPKGDYHVKWAIDGNNEIWETNENNNVVQVQSVIVRVKSTIDLRDRGPQHHSLSAVTRKPGEQLTIRGDVYNGGNLGSGPYKVAFYLSTDEQIHPAHDIKIGEKSMPGLSKGDYVALDHTVQIPLAIANGTYTIGWIIDPEGTATQNEGLIVLDQQGGGQEPKMEYTPNNKVAMISPKLTISSSLLDDGSDAGDGTSGPGDVVQGGAGGASGGGTDPIRDPDPSTGTAGAFEITSFRIEEDQALIGFPTEVGRIYTLEVSPDCRDWVPAQTTTGTGSTVVLSHPRRGHPRMFYRISVPDEAPPLTRE